MQTELCDNYSRRSLGSDDVRTSYDVPTICQNLNYSHQMHYVWTGLKFLLDRKIETQSMPHTSNKVSLPWVIQI